MSTQTKTLLTEIVDNFGQEILGMNKHDRNVLLIALASQEYFETVYPSKGLAPLSDYAQWIEVEDDRTTDEIPRILERFTGLTQSERMAFIQVIAQAIGGE